TGQFSPLTEERKTLLIREKGKAPPPPEILTKIPLREQWLRRGKVYTRARRALPPSDSDGNSRDHRARNRAANTNDNADENTTTDTSDNNAGNRSADTRESFPTLDYTGSPSVLS